MTTTPEQIDVVAQMRLMIQSAVEDDARAWELTDTELAVIADAAINAMRPFIRAEALEEAVKVASEREEERVGIPCPDGIKGCAVFHFRRETRPRNHIEIIAAIRALKEKL